MHAGNIRLGGTVRLSALAAVVASVLVVTSATHAATLVAAYTFNGNLNAQQGGVPALAATNPLGTNAFGTATVLGSTESVYSFNSSSGNNAGLTFNDGSNLISPTSYSIEMVFELGSSENYASGAWLRLVDSQNRQSDDGLYVNPSSEFAIFPDGSGTPGTLFSPNTYFDLILTDDGTTASVYINGTFDFSVANQGAGLNQLNLSNANNPNQLLNLFLDNTVAGGQGEFTSGQIALFEAFNGVLSSSDVATLAADPYANASPGNTPEPGTWVLLTAGGALLAFRKRRA
jgi:hypothetical protein